MVNGFKFFDKKPKLETKESLHPTEVGATGTKNYSGYFDEEYLTKLQGLDAIDRYDEMRRSDGQVKMLLSVVKNPILSASWGVEPVDDSDEEKEIAAFAEHILFHDIGYEDGSKEKTYRQFLREALTFIDFGHSVFEVVHKPVFNHPRFGNYLGLKDLSFRSQKTLEEWHIARNGALSYIRQVTEGDITIDVKLKGEHLLVLTNELEGSNYEGISALRSIYGNHFRKNTYRKLQAIGIERGASGVPMGEIDDDLRNSGNFNAQWTAFKKMLKNFAANNQNYIALEKGFKVSELKISHDAEKVQSAINGENVEMTKAFLANFMELGMSGGSGSYSLGSDLSDIFLSSIQTIADEVADMLKRRVMKKLIRAKYGEREFYPNITATGINDKAGKELAEVVKMLIDAGAIKQGDRLEAHLHKLYKLPQVEREQEDDDGNDDPEDKNKKPAKVKPKPKKDQTEEIEEIEEEKLSDDYESILLSDGGVSLKYPASVVKNAATALRLNDEFTGLLKTQDLVIAKKLSQGDSLSIEQVRRLASYDRNRDSYRPEMKEDNGAPNYMTLSWLARGGTDGIDWAIKKVNEIENQLSDIILADQKKKTDAPQFIERSAKELATRMRESLSESALLFRDVLLTNIEKDADREKLFNVKMPDRKKYEAMLTTFLVDISDKAQKAALKEVGKEDAKLASLKDLPKKTRRRLLAEIALLAGAHYDEIEKISYFFLNQRIDTEADAEDTIAELERMHDAQLDKSTYDVGALNAVSGAVNGIRNDIFQTQEVLDDIDSFVFVNDDPKSPICQHLAGRVFSQEEYASSPYLPPLHHRCKSTVRAQTKGDPDNLPLSKEGLSITAQGSSREKIIKSKNF